MRDRSLTVAVRIAWVARRSVLILAGLLSLAACSRPAGSPAARVTDVAQLQAEYVDIQFDGWTLVADLATADQVGRFAVTDAGGQPVGAAPLALAPRPGSAQPPHPCLAAVLRGPHELLTLDVSRLAAPTPPGDWRDFGVFLWGVYAPPDGLDVLVSIVGGSSSDQAWTRGIHAEPGWNRLRIDLDEVGRHLDLGSIRSISWCLAPGASETTLYLADLALANRTHWLLGGKEGRAGDPYAFARGERLIVGARERFELALSEGVIGGWHADSPENLTVPTGLGPWPVPVPPDWFTQSSPTVSPGSFRMQPGRGGPASAQRLVEASALRVVVQGRRAQPVDRPDSDEAAAINLEAQRSWRYTIYPDGRVYVLADYVPGAALERGARVGFALALDGRSNFHLAPAPPADPYHSVAPLALLARSGPHQADLFWSCALPAAIAHRRLVQLGEQQSLVVLGGDLPAEAVAESAHLLRFWPQDLDQAGVAEPLAADYQSPVTLRPSVGQAVTDAPGDLNHDGFNESEGCYEVAPRRGVLRVTFDPGELPRQAPIFRVRGTAGWRCWVYVDGQAIAADHRDADGLLLFTLPGRIQTPRLIEVHVQGGT